MTYREAWGGSNLRNNGAAGAEAEEQRMQVAQVASKGVSRGGRGVVAGREARGKIERNRPGGRDARERVRRRMQVAECKIAERQSWVEKRRKGSCPRLEFTTKSNGTILLQAKVLQILRRVGRAREH